MERIPAEARAEPLQGTRWRVPFAQVSGGFYTGCVAVRPGIRSRPRAVAQFGRAPVSKTGGWGFKSLRPCKGEA